MPEITLRQYQEYRQAQGLSVPVPGTVKRQILSHKLWGRNDIGGRWLVDPEYQSTILTPSPLKMEIQWVEKDGFNTAICQQTLYQMKKTGRFIIVIKVPQHIEVPDSERWQALGSDKVRAVDAAKQLNQQFGIGADLVARALSKINGIDKDFYRYIDYFINNILPTRKTNSQTLSPETITEYKRIGQHLKNE